MPARRTRVLFLALTAFAGVVVAHTADYLTLLPDGARRARYLAATGHGYWSEAVIVAAVAAAVVVAVALRGGWRGALTAVVPASEAGPWTPPLAALCAGQVVLFGAMEALERIGAGVPVGALFLSREFLLGVALQVVVAAAAVMLLGAVQRVAARVARAVRRRRVVARPRTLPAVGRIAAPPRAARGLRLRARAPPSAAC